MCPGTARMQGFTRAARCLATCPLPTTPRPPRTAGNRGREAELSTPLHHDHHANGASSVMIPPGLCRPVRVRRTLQNLLRFPVGLLVNPPLRIPLVELPRNFRLPRTDR